MCELKSMRKEIEEMAYDRYEFRCENGISGTAEEDWLFAEKEVRWFYNPNKHYHAKEFPRIIQSIRV